jgi:hypothetical protein
MKRAARAGMACAMLALSLRAAQPQTEDPAARAERAAWIEAYVARWRDDACGTHWVGNPSFAACMAMLRREAEAAYRRQAGERHPAPPAASE